MLFKVTALWVLAGLILGLVSIILFNFFTAHLNIGTACVWSFAYFVLGGLAGFIFGVPKKTYDAGFFILKSFLCLTTMKINGRISF
jgi:hypothetical protein